jgi:hypothetical protein
MILHFFIHFLNLVLFKGIVWVFAYMAKYMGFHDVDSNAITRRQILRKLYFPSRATPAENGCCIRQTNIEL